MPIQLYVILYIVAIVGFFLFAALAYLRQRAKAHINFALFAAAAGMWQGLQGLAQLLHQHHELAVILLHASFVSAGFMAIFFYWFAQTFTNGKPHIWISSWLAGIVAVVSLFSSNISSAEITNTGVSLAAVDFPYASLLTFAGVYFLWGLKRLIDDFIRAWRQKNTVERQRDSILIGGIAQALVLIVFFSVAYANAPAAQIAVPLSCLIAVATIAYAVIFRGLFDIHAVVARALGYVLSLGLLAGAFIAIAATIVGLKATITLDQARWIYAFLAVLLAILFPWVRQFFDRITNRIFYRDAYDPQELLGKLNKLLVSSLDLSLLMNGTTLYLSDYLRPQFVTISLKNDTNAFRVFGDRGTLFATHESTRVRQLAPKIKQSIIIVDELEQPHAELQQLLRAHGIALLVRLTNRVQRSDEGVGYMALGFRKSGSPYTRQDINTLEVIANELVLAVQNALRYEQIQTFAQTLQERVNDATRRLRRSNDRLKELDEAKDDFVSMASHQLRTPLTSVKGYVSLVLDGDAGKITKQQRDLLNQAFASSQRMVYLIADLLNVSRLKTGKFVIENTTVNLANVVEQEINQLQDLAKTKNQTLTFEKPAEFPDLQLDDTKIRQVIMNFTDNALHYTPANGNVVVSLHETPSSVELRVKDNGIGVPKSEIPHLFTKFYRAGNARKARPDGTGLGLFMAKKVIVAQGGSVIFNSEEGKGSTFGFIFPKSTLLTPTVSIDKNTSK